MLIEWLIERRRPGPVGTVDIDHPEPSRLRPVGLVLRGALAGGLIGYGAFLAAGASRPLATLSLLGFYLFVAYFVNPKPDPTNVGWAGGLIDHPFRWSDDKNRLLFALKVLLLPGRFAVTGVRDVVQLTRQRLGARRAREKQVVWQRRD